MKQTDFLNKRIRNAIQSAMQFASLNRLLPGRHQAKKEKVEKKRKKFGCFSALEAVFVWEKEGFLKAIGLFKEEFKEGFFEETVDHERNEVAGCCFALARIRIMNWEWNSEF